MFCGDLLLLLFVCCFLVVAVLHSLFVLFVWWLLITLVLFADSLDIDCIVLFATAWWLGLLFCVNVCLLYACLVIGLLLVGVTCVF